jgi:hypothetical protein
MNLDKIANVAGAIVGVAAITAVVSNSNTAAVIRAAGEAFAGSIRAALGR